MTSVDELATEATHEPAALFGGIGNLPFEIILSAHPNLPKFMSPLDPVATAATFAGLLTIPELQGNTCRVEALVHCALAFGSGSRKPPSSTIAFWFSELSNGPCGHFEDPPEDVFTSVVTSSHGNFRILEGTWESAAFYLQRVVNIVERMPPDEPFNSLRESVFSLLTMSDMVCERAALARYTFGSEQCESALPKDVKSRLSAYRQRVVFSPAELKARGVSLEALSQFSFIPELRASIPSASLTHSPLVERPILLTDNQVVLVLPTAVSTAIRAFVIQYLCHAGLKETLVRALEVEYKRCFREFPPMGIDRHAPLMFRETEHGTLASCAQEVDTGRLLHLVFTLDTLNGFERSGFAVPNHDPLQLSAEISREIAECRRYAMAERGIREGLTVIIGCGIGRAEAYMLDKQEFPEWRVAYLSAADAVALSGLSGEAPRTISRILEAEDRLAQQGVKLVNVNGILALISRARQLKGHLVPHSRMPEMPEEGGRLVVLIEPSAVLHFRREVRDRVDLHAVRAPDGKWVRVRKADRSYFEEDRANLLYAPCRPLDEAGLPMVYETTSRQWWCTVEHPLTYDRWKMLSTWLPRIAAALDREVTGLPQGPLELIIRFKGYSPNLPTGSAESTDDILEAIRVEIDPDGRRVVVETDESFEHGLHNPKNIAETALVRAIVGGFLRLNGTADSIRIRELSQQILRNDDARDGHSFEARRFRDFVRDSVRTSVVTVDEIDDATLRLGLGWRIRLRQAGPLIEGKADCTAYLNALVRRLEAELCDHLKQFDRKSLVTLALENYETAMVDRRRWQDTTAAMLALHNDQAKALATIAEHDSQNNAAMLASRLLVEAAVCECHLQGGATPGEMDLSQLMARLLLIVTYGGWSDAIHYDAMPPVIRITPLGDIHADLTFVETVVTPFGHAIQKNLVEASINRYPDLFTPQELIEHVEPKFDQQFVEAWNTEHGYSLEELRLVCDEVEDFGVERDAAVFSMPKSELLARVSATVPTGAHVVSSLMTIPRPEWRTSPAGFEEKDRQPWRFRRRLSLLRLPIVQLDDGDDPSLVVAPGLLRDALVYTASGHHEGSFPSSQLHSREMKAWFGVAVDQRGNKFTEDVARRLKELGWRCETEVGVKAILGKRTPIDYGDIDVFAVHPVSNRILLIECKDLHFHKTLGELAEQLSDYRGGTRNGKRDSLKKHIDRAVVLRNNAPLMLKFAKLQEECRIECWLVFRNPVPMLFALNESAIIDGVTTIATLDTI